ncbi:MAG: protein kinase [Acidobacteria bacterium]|nr:protein kinase [Acidobacteriota bacterium]
MLHCGDIQSGSESGQLNFPAGTTFGRYEIVSLLGSGGMGEVYLAQDKKLGRRIALKLLPPRFTGDSERVRRFQQEARAASALNHPNIITIFEVGETEHAHFIASEYVEGQTLGQRLNDGALDLSEALEIGIQVAGALSAAHRAGIIHRDIKADNIMLRPDGYVKVLDFGLAKLTETFVSGAGAEPEAATRPLNATSPGVIMGTVSYMSPEQARGFKVDARSDLFSLGVVIYEMLTGRLPFTGDSGSDIISAILNQESQPVTRWRREAPSDLEWIIARMLAKDRNDRFQSADEVVAALKRVRQQIAFQAETRRANEPTLCGDEAEAALPDISLSPPPRPRTPSYDTNRFERGLRKSNLEYLVGVVAGHRRESLLVAGLLLFTLGALFYYRYVQQAATVDSIAVIPFVHTGGDEEAEALADGITLGVIRNLSRLPKLRVQSLSAVMRYKPSDPAGSPPDPRQIGRDLNVPVVLTGRIAPRNGGLRISIELVDAGDNSYLWGMQYDRRRSELLALDEVITRDVSQQLKLNLDAKEVAQLEAYQYYLRGRYYLNKRTEGDLRQGVENFRRSIELDASFAPAMAGLADSYNLLATYGAISPSEGFTKGREAAEEALRINERSAEAHTSLAYVKHRYDWDWAGADREFKRAIELDPNYAPAHQWYASYLLAVGRTTEAIASARRSQELDSLSLIVNSHLAWVLYLSRQPEPALVQSKRILALDENFFPGLRYAGLAYELSGRYQEAIAAFNKARELSGGSPVILGALAHAHAVEGNRQEARRLLDGILADAPRRRVSTYEVAVIYAGLGEKGKSFEWLEKAFVERNEYLNYLMVDPRLDPLRSDPRYFEMLKRIGLAQQSL